MFSFKLRGDEYDQFMVPLPKPNRTCSFHELFLRSSSGCVRVPEIAMFSVSYMGALTSFGVQVPLTLSLALNQGEESYTLTGFAIRTPGSHRSGHYVAFIKQNGKWRERNDTSDFLTTEEEVRDKLQNSPVTTLIFNKITATTSEKEKLGQEQVKQNCEVIALLQKQVSQNELSLKQLTEKREVICQQKEKTAKLSKQLYDFICTQNVL